MFRAIRRRNRREFVIIVVAFARVVDIVLTNGNNAYVSRLFRRCCSSSPLTALTAFNAPISPRANVLLLLVCCIEQRQQEGGACAAVIA